MTREEAYYMRLKILCGYTEDYNNLLDRHLQAENPLSDIVLSLTDCRDNAKEIESRLNSFCLEKPFDEESVYSKFRTELSEQYEKNTISTEEVVYILNTLSQKLPVCSFQNHCNMLSDCYELAKTGVFDIEKYDFVLKEWLKKGTEVHIDKAFAKR